MLAVVVASVVLGACGGSDDEERTAPGQANATTTVTTPRATTTTAGPIEGVQTFPAEQGHTDGTVNYPQVPPVGGLHNPLWQPCGFYDQPIPNEKAVHSLEHGAIWITHRPDLPAADIATLAALARGRNYVLVSPWPDGLPSPVVLTGWGRQLRLESISDPRLNQFVLRYAGQGPEVNGPCS